MQMNDSLTWRDIGSQVYLHLKPVKLIQIVELASFGVVLMKVAPGSTTAVGIDTDKPVIMHNSPCNYLRIGGAGLSEIRFEGGLVRKALGFIRKVRATDLLGDLQGIKPRWMLVVRGPITSAAGQVILTSASAETNQASFTPIFKMESALAATYEEANAAENRLRQATEDGTNGESGLARNQYD